MGLQTTLAGHRNCTAQSMAHTVMEPMSNQAGLLDCSYGFGKPADACLDAGTAPKGPVYNTDACR
jgi:hypothetical protein